MRTLVRLIGIVAFVAGVIAYQGRACVGAASGQKGSIGLRIAVEIAAQ